MFDRRLGACGGVVQQYAANELITRFEKQPEIGEESLFRQVTLPLGMHNIGYFWRWAVPGCDNQISHHERILAWKEPIERNKAVNHNETCLSTYSVAFQPTSVLNSALPLHSLVNSPLSSVSSALPFPTADSFVNESRAPWSRELHEE